MRDNRRRIARLTRVSLAGAVVATAAGAVPSPALASQLLDRNAKAVRLAVNNAGMAMVTYEAAGRTRHVLAWGAVNARHPDPGTPQVRFKVDYGGGWSAFRKPLWKTFKNACRPYDGPPLPWLVAACKAPDGSYWALQSWQRGLPNYGVAPTATQAAHELRISHRTGPVAELDVGLDWIHGGLFHHLFGRVTYRGQPVHGFRSTRAGVPLDTYGRNLYVDTYNSGYGRGWRRENSFLAQKPTGAFCYGFYPARAAAASSVGAKLRGNGERYRMTVIGPGVTPDVRWEGPGLSDFDAANPAHVAREREMNALRGTLAAGDRLCQQN